MRTISEADYHTIFNCNTFLHCIFKQERESMVKRSKFFLFFQEHMHFIEYHCRKVCAYKLLHKWAESSGQGQQPQARCKASNGWWSVWAQLLALEILYRLRNCLEDYP